MLNLYQIQMFLAVVDCGSFSAAGEQLHVTQPAVSEGVRALEQRLGERLFDRRGHRASLTPEGAALVVPARLLLEQAGQAEQELHRQRGVITGTLRLATATSAAGPALAERLGDFVRRNPGVRCSLVAREPAAVLHGLRSGEFDAGFLGEEPRDSRALCEPVASDEWVLLAPPGHSWTTDPHQDSMSAAEIATPLRRKRGRPPAQRPAAASSLPGLPLGTLLDQPLVLEWAESVHAAEARRELRDLLDDRGLPWGGLRRVLEVGGPTELVRAVERGAGVGIVSLSQLSGYSGPAVAFRVEGSPLMRALLAVRDRRALLSPATAALWADLHPGAQPTT